VLLNERESVFGVMGPALWPDQKPIVVNHQNIDPIQSNFTQKKLCILGKILGVETNLIFFEGTKANFEKQLFYIIY
jgi:hypothetical protein